MIPATQEQIEAACMTRSAADAVGFLAFIGLEATNRQCRYAIADMLADGRRKSVVSTGAVDREITLAAFDAQMGCARMLDAMVASFQHKAKRLGISFEQAMASSLGNQAVRA